MMNETIVLKLEGNLSTNFAGVSRLFNFYHKAKVYTDTIIFIDFYHLHWFDANLSALLGAILSKLNTENTLTFSTDLTYLEEKFDVLFRNGFFTSENLKQDDRQSTISFYQFNLSDDAGFIRYIEKDLMCHRGMPALTKEQSNEIIDSLIEVYNNIQIHSHAKYDCFVCGQFFPKQNKLVFTMLDLGVGFLPAIRDKTNGYIADNYMAIKWALEKKNSTKINSLGGLGLFNLEQYFRRTCGDMQIITGDVFWSISLDDSLLKKHNLKEPFVGTVLNLFFSI